MNKKSKAANNNEAIKQQKTDTAKEFKNRVDYILTSAMGNYSDQIEFKVFDRGCPHSETKPTEKKVREELEVANEKPLFDSAVYVFYYPDGKKYLKIGEVGGNSTARFFSQHYNPRSAKSTLAKSIVKSNEFRTKENKPVCEDNVKCWMEKNLQRIDIIFTKSGNPFVSKFVESYLHFVLQPRFEGNREKKSATDKASIS